MSLPSRLFLLGLLSAQVQAVQLDQLEVPRTYLRYLPQLLDGAKLMAASEQCAVFISGKVKVDDSREDQPVFSYTCRDAQSMTYRWRVDGLTLEILDETRPEGRISFAQLQAEIDARRERERELEAQRQAQIAQIQAQRAQVEQQREAERQRKAEEEARRREARRRERLWGICQETLQRQTRTMNDLVWVTTEQPEALELELELAALPSPDPGALEQEAGSMPPSQEEQGEGAEAAEMLQPLRFTIDFNASDYFGEALEYRAYCDIDEQEVVQVSIHPRRLEEAEAPIAP